MSSLAYLISQYPTVSHTFILREVRALRALGFDINVVSIRKPDRAAADLTAVEREETAQTTYVKAGVKEIAGAHGRAIFRRPLAYLKGLSYAVRLGGSDAVKIVKQLLYFGEAVFVGDWMERRRLRHVHTHFVSSVALLVARVFPVTFSATIHGSDEFIDPVGFRLPEKIHQAAFIFAISNYGKSQLMRVSPPADWAKLSISRLGVDPLIFPPRPFIEERDPVELICVARLVPVKAHRLLLRACADLVREGRALVLRLVGDGPDREALERFAAELGIRTHVIFHGSLTQEKVIELYETADAFVLASFAEGIPVVLMEAMAMEIPCVAPRITGIPELIRDGVDGLLVTPVDVPGMTDAIRRLITQPELRRSFGVSGRTRILEHYDINKNIRGLAELFQSELKKLA